MHYSTAHPHTLYHLGFTLIELLIVIVILGIISAAGITNYVGAHNNQLLGQTAQYVADTMQRASNYSQTARDDKIWGVISSDQKKYSIISKVSGQSDDQAVIDQTTELPHSIMFQQPFTIWFSSGTGYVAQPTSVTLQLDPTKTATIKLTTTGVITVTHP